MSVVFLVHISEYGETIRKLADELNLPIVDFSEDTKLAANDLWLGCSPNEGWSEDAEKTMWGQTAEACIVVRRLAVAIGTDEANTAADSAVEAELASLQA